MRSLALTIATLIALHLLFGGQTVRPQAVQRQQTVSVTEGTELVATLSPDGKRIALLLLGQVWLVDRNGGRATPVTDVLQTPRNDYGMAWAPDSRRLVVWDYNGRPTPLRVIDVDSRQVTVLPGRAGMDYPVWTRDGNAITASIVHGESAGLWNVPVSEAGEPVLLARLARVTWQPSYSPDGKFLVYSSPARALPEPIEVRNDLWEIDLATGAERQLTSGPSVDVWPAYSRDGRWLAFVSDRSGTPQVWTLPRAGGEAFPLTRDVKDVYLISPLSWLPDSRGVIFTAAGRIHVAWLDNTPATTIEFTADLTVGRWEGRRRAMLPGPGERRRARGIFSPSLSPDGTRVAFSALGDLWIANVAGGRAMRLTRTPYEEAFPRWSPDGRRLVFRATREFWQLQLVDLDRPNAPRTLLTSASENHEPDTAWSPDGRRLAYVDQGTLRWLDVESGATKGNLQTSGFSYRILGWSRGSDAIAIAATRWDSALRRTVRQVWRAQVPDGAMEIWGIPPELSLWAAWTRDLSRVAYSVNGVGYYVELQQLSRPVRIVDPTPREFSWSADGRRLLYLSRGQLRLLDTARNAAVTLNVSPEYTVAPAPPPLLVRNIRILDGSGAVADGVSDVLVSNSRIQRIAPAGRLKLPDGARQIDGEGRFALPGLIDAHAHLGISWLPSRVYKGELAIRDLGEEAERNLALRERVESGDLLGPRIFMSGGLIIASEDADGFRSKRPVDLQNAEAVEREIASLAAMRPDWIKTYSSDGRLGRVIDAAHKYGLPFTSHFVSASALARGLDGKEHINLYYHNMTALYRQDLLLALRAAGAWVTPTIGVYASQHLAGRSTVVPLDAAYWDDPAMAVLYPPSVVNSAKAALRRQVSEGQLKRWTEFERQDLENIRRLRQAGVRIVTGSDHDYGVHLEMEYLVKAGFPPLEAIRAATLDAARCLGADQDLGSISTGKLADFLIVDGDPTKDIRDARKIVWIFLGGKPYTREEILNKIRLERESK